MDPPPAVPRVAGARGIWRFNEGGGGSVLDSAMPPAGFGPMHLTVEQPSAVNWTLGGLTLNARCTIDTSITPHVGNLIVASGQFTVEVWVTSSTLNQGLDPPDGSAPDHGNIFNASGSIVSYSALIGQVGDRWIGRARTANTGADAMPEIPAMPNSVVVGEPSHLVLVANSTARILYVDGVPYSSVPVAAGTVGWDEAYKIRLGDAIVYDRTWLGTIYFMAIYDKALSPTEVKQNHDARHSCSEC